MIFVFFCTKESTRFPGKNALLLPYTLAWLGYAAQWLTDPVLIVHAGAARPEGLPDGIPHINVPPTDHKNVLLHAMRELDVSAEDICVQTQLTQPLREPRLLRRAVDTHRQTGLPVVTVTASTYEPWREVDSRGRWKSTGQQHPHALRDGVLDVWRGVSGLDAIFDARAEHATVPTNVPLLVDIDTPADLPPALPSIWAATILQSA